jgi:hypothetical protein
MQRALIISIIAATFTTYPARAAVRRELPTSVAVFFSAIEALAKADERPDGISAAANITRIKPLMQQVIDAGAKCNRAELNALYPGWGDHFLDDAVAHARFILQFMETGDSDTMTRAMGTIIRWQQWWKPNQDKIMTLVADRFG